jgi:Fic family protein
MDLERFGPASPGSLVGIGGGDKAFVPTPLPPSWPFPVHLWPLLAEAKQSIGVLEGIGRTLPNPEILITPLQQREAIRSSSLEGTFATPEELLLFDNEQPEATSAHEPSNAWREVYNYASALRLGTTTEQPLSLHLIRTLHHELMKGVRGRDQSPGQFRTNQVHIGHGKRFVPPPVVHLQACLDALQDYLNAGSDGFDPLVRAYLVHYQFETIHPFHDGNGRVGRLLLSVMLLRACGLTKPWLYMSAFFDRYKDEYIDRLFDVSAAGAWDRWIGFCLRGTIDQAKDTIRRCERLLAIREDYLRRIGTSGSMRLGRIVERCFSSPVFRVTDLQKALDVTYPTAKADIARLCTLGILKELTDRKQKTFCSPDILLTAFHDVPA